MTKRPTTSPTTDGRERGDRNETPIGATLLLAYVVEPAGGSALESWRRHLDEDSSTQAASDSALFAVLEGEGDYLLVHEFRVGEEERAPQVERSIRTTFGPDRLVHAAAYQRIFAADDARPLSAASRFVFLAAASVDSRLNHAEFNNWYDTAHVPDVAGAGLLRAQRFRLLGAGNDYLASYEIESPEVLASPELARIRGFHHFTPDIRQLRRAVAELIRDQA
jgi:hypothetical protein